VLGRLRQDLTLHHLLGHLPQEPVGATALDAGGGTGGYAMALARAGYRVCLLDCSGRMLELARQSIEHCEPALRERIDLCRASLALMPPALRAKPFDAILLHTVLEYLQEPWEVLAELLGMLAPGGLASLLITNARAEALRWAWVKGDLQRARQALLEPASAADLFGLPRQVLPLATVRAALRRAGLEVRGEYGIRIFADYLPAERLTDGRFLAQLIALEQTASEAKDLLAIARYWHIVASRPA
jgi:S-adenosylmethionine-dependent methyltransferase